MEMQSPTIGSLAKALAEAQEELSPASKNAKNPFFRSKYADLAEVFAAVKAVLPKHGLSVSQPMCEAPEGYAGVRTILMHESGEWLAGVMNIPLPKDKDGNCGPQQMGSAITYAKRYSLSAIVGVVSEDDDDAEAAQKPYRQQAQQQRQPKPQQPSKRDMLCKVLAQQFGEPKACLAELSMYLTRSINSTTDLTDEEVEACLKEYNKEAA